MDTPAQHGGKTDEQKQINKQMNEQTKDCYKTTPGPSTLIFTIADILTYKIRRLLPVQFIQVVRNSLRMKNQNHQLENVPLV